MNIFLLDNDPVQAAFDQCNKHRVKMVLETCQLLNNACPTFGYPELPKTDHLYSWLGPRSTYKQTHFNHPCSVWARSNHSHFVWLLIHGLSLSDAYSESYPRTHKCQWPLSILAYQVCEKFNVSSPIDAPHTPEWWPIAMPDQYQLGSDVVNMYRQFYKAEKSYFAKWPNNQTPSWWLL